MIVKVKYREGDGKKDIENGAVSLALAVAVALSMAVKTDSCTNGRNGSVDKVGTEM